MQSRTWNGRFVLVLLWRDSREATTPLVDICDGLLAGERAAETLETPGMRSRKRRRRRR
jgi:hypothetical protein